jgi:hypothetical protein
MKKLVLLVLPVMLLLLISLPAEALGPSFGLKGGMDMQMFGNGESVSQWWPSFGGLVELSLPAVPIAFRGEAGYAWHIEEDITSSDMNVIVSGKYSISPPLSPLGFYLGAGPGLHIFKVGDFDSESYFGIHAYAGLNIKMGLNILVEAGYGMIFPDAGSWNQLNLKLGMML